MCVVGEGGASNSTCPPPSCPLRGCSPTARPLTPRRRPPPHPLPAGKPVRAHIVQTQPFGTTFGKKQTRKRPKLAADSYNELLEHAQGGADEFGAKPAAVDGDERAAARDSIFEKGQSRRIWGELYKVVDSSDVIIQARAQGVGAARSWRALT